MEIYTLKVSKRTIFRYLDKEKLNGSKIGQWRFTEKDLKEFISRDKKIETKDIQEKFKTKNIK